MASLECPFWTNPTGMSSLNHTSTRKTLLKRGATSGASRGFCMYRRDTYHIEGNFHMVQTFTVFADDPTTVKIKTANVLTAQLVLPYSSLLRNKSYENLFWSLWWHYRESLHWRKFPAIRDSVSLRQSMYMLAMERATYKRWLWVCK